MRDPITGSVPIKQVSELPQAPGRMPLLGHAWPLVRQPFAFLESLRTIGDIVRVDIGTMPVYMLTRPELVHAILVTEARKIERGMIFDRARPLLGDGLGTSEGQLHLRQRRLMQPALHPNNIGTYVDLMRQNTQHCMESWHDDRTIDVRAAMSDLVMRNTTGAVFRTSVDERVTQAVLRAVQAIIDNVMVRMLTPKFLEWFPLPANRRFDTASRQSHQIIDQIITDRLENPQHGEDLLGMLLTTKDPETGEPMSRQQIHSAAIAIFVAGITTTATTLAWLWYEFTRWPDVEEQVVEEIGAVLGTGVPLSEAIHQLDYTRRAVQEVLRIHPVLLFTRRTTQPLTLGTAELPPRTELWYSPYTLHRDPQIYPEPLQVDPDRWLPERAKPLPIGAFAAFGAGRHRCIGEHLAWAQILIAVALLVPRWKLRLPSGHQVREVNGVHPRPNKLHMTITSR